MSYKYFYFNLILKISQRRGLRDPKYSLSLSPSSSFFSFFKGLGAGAAGTLPVRIISAIFIPLLTAMPAATSTGGYLIEHGGLEYD